MPLPVADRGGWRVDTGLPSEVRRYVFAGATPGLVALGTEIDRPCVPIKLCADNAALRGLLPERWEIAPASFVMTGPPPPSATLPKGYRIETIAEGIRLHVRIVDAAGDLAASGYAASAGEVFCYDRIVTAPAHRRRGLGRAVMATLGGAAPRDARHVLVATFMGRSLFEALGWRVVSPYASALIPEPPQPIPRLAGPNASGSSSDSR